MRRTVRLLALVMMLAACSAAAPAASVRDRVIAIVRVKLPKAMIVSTDPQGFSIMVAGRDENSISVQRITDFCAANTVAECDDQIETFATSIVDLTTTDFTVTRERLRIVVRNRLDTDGYLATVPEIAKRPLVRPLFDGTSAVLAADFPKGIRMVTAEDLVALKLGADDAFALGTDQVLAVLPPVPKLSEIDGKLIAIQGFDYGASVMLRPERWADLAKATGGRLFIAIPGDNGVLIGMTKVGENPNKLKALAAEEFRLAPRGISPRVYRWSAAGWVAIP